MRRKSEPSCLLDDEEPTRLDTTSATELRISESDLTTAVEEEGGLSERKRTLEEIVGQLLMQNREFQRILSKQKHLMSRRRTVDTSDEEEDGKPTPPR
jgi:hypothetical protein